MNYVVCNCGVYTSACVFQMFLTVYLSNNDQHFTEVPITPETVCRDVVELCKEPGDANCHLAEVWKGSGESLVKNGALLPLISICPLSFRSDLIS